MWYEFSFLSYLYDFNVNSITPLVQTERQKFIIIIKALINLKYLLVITLKYIVYFNCIFKISWYEKYVYIILSFIKCYKNRNSFRFVNIYVYPTLYLGFTYLFVKDVRYSFDRCYIMYSYRDFIYALSLRVSYLLINSILNEHFN